MATRYLLHGGSPFTPNDGGSPFTPNVANDAFIREILTGGASPLHVLSVCFARSSPDRALACQKACMGRFEANNTSGLRLSFELADSAIFEAQVSRAGVVFLHGGDTSKLLAALRPYDLQNLFEGKVVAGESAGSYALSTRFFSKTEGGVFQGLGLVPAQIICHYAGVNQERLPPDPGLDTWLLPDFHYRVHIRP